MNRDHALSTSVGRDDGCASGEMQQMALAAEIAPLGPLPQRPIHPGNFLSYSADFSICVPRNMEKRQHGQNTKKELNCFWCVESSEENYSGRRSVTYIRCLEGAIERPDILDQGSVHLLPFRRGGVYGRAFLWATGW
jgi:hypothetical protein